MNKGTILGSLTCVIIITSLSNEGAATCARGTPDVNRVLAAAVTDLSGFNDFYRINLSLGADTGWDVTRGINDPLNTDFEYNKLLLAALILMSGIDSTEPIVAPDPITGKYRYDPDTLYLNEAFHRSRDEWGGIAGDGAWTVCDRLNADTGEFECPKSGIWPFEGYSKFGKETRTGITDVIPLPFQLTGAPADSASGVIHWGSADSYYFCPAFEDETGAVDPLVLPSLVGSIVDNSWLSLQDERGKSNQRSFRWDLNGVRRQAIARDAIDRDLALYQIRHQALCDVVAAHESWVPLMVVEAFNFAFLNEAEEPRFDNTNSLGQSPYTCGLPEDRLVLEPGVDHCVNGTLACQTDEVCDDGVNLTTDFCAQGCCVNESYE